MRRFLKYHIKDRWNLAMQAKQLRNSSEMPVLILTMAKVGSLSVYSSLKQQSDIPIFHIHSLSKEETLAGDKLCFENGIYPGSRSPVFLINDEILEKDKPYKIISLFRNPIDRNLSAFFDAFELHTGSTVQNYKGSVKELEVLYHEKLSHNYAKDWFEKQFFNGTGINVYEHPFVAEKGHAKWVHGKVEVLLMNSGLEDTLKEKLVSEFCEVPDFELVNVNVTAASKASGLYNDFKKHIKFSREYLENQLESRYMSHFFTEEEKRRLYERWEKK